MKPIHWSLWPASLFGSAALAFIWTAPASAAATQLFLTWQGLIGPVTIPGHAGAIEITSYVQNASRNPPSGDGNVSPAVCGQVTVTKLTDKASPILLGQVLTGQPTPQVTVIFATQEKGIEVTYYTVTLQGVIATSIKQSDSTTDVITETLSLQANRFIYTFTPQRQGGTADSHITFGWDCTQNRPI